MKKILSMVAQTALVASLLTVGGIAIAESASAMNVCKTVKTVHTVPGCINWWPGATNPCIYTTTKTVCSR